MAHSWRLSVFAEGRDADDREIAAFRLTAAQAKALGAEADGSMHPASAFVEVVAEMGVKDDPVFRLLVDVAYSGTWLNSIDDFYGACESCGLKWVPGKGMFDKSGELIENPYG